MQFIDEARIYIKAGNGGDGSVSFRREKFIDRGGPDGGNGGRGGSIILVCNTNLNTLLQFRYNRHFIAQDGSNGKGRNMTGKSGQDLILEVPLGTQVCIESEDFESGKAAILFDFTKEGESFEVLAGGKGGLGNANFKSSTNRSPRKRTEGESGEELDIVLKLKLLSDAGLIGLPNAGKSTFLSVTTSATPKIADYPFTTLKPALGVVYVDEEEFVLADIPGLIKGAHTGSGLGDRFLKHIERCRILIHLIDANTDNIVQDYLTIRNELASYSDLLAEKKEIICINKIDLLTKEELDIKLAELKSLDSCVEIYPISTYTKFGISAVIKKTLQITKDYL